jgi:hypothetical protein
MRRMKILGIVLLLAMQAQPLLAAALCAVGERASRHECDPASDPSLPVLAEAATVPLGCADAAACASTAPAVPASGLAPRSSGLLERGPATRHRVNLTLQDLSPPAPPPRV